MTATTLGETEQDALSERFLHFGRVQCMPSSPLYAQLAEEVAGNVALLELAAYARPGQPVANLFFAAVHFLLLTGTVHPLAAFYPDLTSAPEANANPQSVFADFCRSHRDALQSLLTTRLVQTNEVRRSACLLPAFALVAQEGKRQTGSDALALIEVGASAGLNLLLDRYAFDYGNGVVAGNPESPVRIACEVRGKRPLPDLVLPNIAFRHGLDLNPVNVRDRDATTWLRALVWPEHADRAILLESALAFARNDPPPMTQGDALDLLPRLMAPAPKDATLCVYHSFALNQFSPEARARFADLLATHSTQRDVYRVSFEGVINGTEVRLTLYRNGSEGESRLLAHADPHGRWFEWLA